MWGQETPCAHKKGGFYQADGKGEKFGSSQDHDSKGVAKGVIPDVSRED